ncbi:DUF4124 domain-containing protein [Ferrimonas marina]|uniref:DUF4124 domain-containing protein n=1 Tax=Ferrimonas marina TaxID=299255 RepID=A0A1M5ZAQ9_9GAMM|nr:DUF4124 domain-containing protein [Ferrimonas marina]SHI21272.1 protein of unknown function [Ferrimonas marina]
MRWSVLFLLMITLPLSASVYKWTDEHGQVHYSDKPREGAEQVEVDPSKISTVELPAPRPVVAQAEPESTQPDYRIALLDPQDEATIRDNNGQLDLQIQLEPDLQDGHRVQLLLDGEVVRTLGGGGSYALDNLTRGEHQLQAQVIDKNGKVLASTASRTVYLHRHSRLFTPPGPTPKPLPNGAP